MKSSFIFITGVLLLVKKCGAQTFPNIIFTMADDLGYGDPGYNGGNASTPNLDAMAAGENTIHLTRYYSGGSVCSPTRGTVLTGNFFLSLVLYCAVKQHWLHKL